MLTTKKQRGIFIGIIVAIVLFGNIALGSFLASKKPTSTPTPIQSGPVVTQAVSADQISYKGVEGKDALTLLKEKATIEQATSGLVNAINGRKADDAKHEYWSFYVNGKLAEVGALDYKTKEGDVIEWKIETY